ncbi:MAG: aminopeptidase N [Paraglaciecola sp.]|jgi:aminopeptidase N
MKYILLGFMLILLSACAMTQGGKRTAYTMKSDGVLPPSQIGLALLNAELHFEVFPDRQSISARSLLTLSTEQPRTEVGINLDNLFTIHQVMVNGRDISAVHYRNPEGLLVMQLSQAVRDNFTVEISYSGQPRVAIKAPWDGGFVWSKTPDGQDWIATAVQGEGCDLFWPCIDYPGGEPRALSMHITVPKNLYAAANGTLSHISEQEDTKTYHWQSLSQINTYGVALNIGPYEVIEQTYKSPFGNEIPVFFYHLPQSAEQATELTKELLEVTAFFETFVGPYPFAQDKIGVVETPHLGMEHQTINAYGNQFKKSKYGFDWLLHHEFAHEWFANQLTNKNANDMWLHEGFAAYMQPLYAEYLYGQVAYMAYMYDQRLSIKNKFPIVSQQVKSVEEVYEEDQGGPSGDIYAKASWVLHTLRQLIGDAAFFKATTELVYGTATPVIGQISPVLADTQDFLAIVNKLTGEDYSWFFEIYFYQAELPTLSNERSGQTLTLSWVTQNDKPFPMPLDVSINGKIIQLHMKTPQKIELGPFDKVTLDPMSKILKDEAYIAQYQEFMQQSKTTEP